MADLPIIDSDIDDVEIDDEGDDEGDEEGDIDEGDDTIDEKYDESNFRRIIDVVPDRERKTSLVMTLFEFSEVIGQRTKQIEEGGQVFTDVSGLTSAREMAKKELFDRRCPFIIVRKVSKTKQEQFNVNEMSIPYDMRSGF